MAPGPILRHLNRLLVAQSSQEQTDAQLLRRFAAAREESAFAALLSRHGRLVWDVCRHTLNHEHDAEDAFQATFLVLARKAGSIRKGESVGSFLYGVAYRTSLKARQSAAARRAREKKSAVVDQQPPTDAGLRELQTILAEEVERLAPKYRTPFVLCCLEGKSKREAADELGWKEGTVSSRLAHARQLLQGRLTRRGIALTAALTTVAVGAGSASAVPAAVFAATLLAAPRFAAGQKISSAAPVALAEGVLHTMFVTKLQKLGMLVALTLVVAGSVAVGRQAFGPNQGVANPDGPALVADKDKPAKAGKPESRMGEFKDNLDSLQLNITLSPLGPSKFDPKFDLYSLLLHVQTLRLEPAALGPSGKPISTNAKVSKEQAKKLMQALADNNFFGLASEELKAPKGPHVLLQLSYQTGPQPVSLYLVLDWNLGMARRLDALRDCLDGDTRKAMDELLKPLEEQHKAWEKEFKAGDLGRLQGAWTLVLTERDGHKVIEEGMTGRCVINGNDITLEPRIRHATGIQSEDNAEVLNGMKGTFELSSDKHPHRMTMKVHWYGGKVDKNETFYVNYDVDAESLWLLVPPPRTEADGMRTKEGLGQSLYVFRRDKGDGPRTRTSAGDRKNLQGAWTLVMVENDRGEQVKNPGNLTGTVKDDKISLQLQFAITGNDLHTGFVTELLEGTFEQQMDKLPRRLVIKGKWTVERATKDGTFTANYLLDGNVLFLLLPRSPVVRPEGQPAADKPLPDDTSPVKGSGQRLFVFVKDKSIEPVVSWAEPLKLKGHTIAVGTVASSPDGKLLATGDADGGLKLWNAHTGELVKTLDPRVQLFIIQDVSGLAFSPDSKTLAVGIGGIGVSLWDVDKGKKIRHLEAGNAERAGMGPLFFTPDGKTLFAGPRVQLHYPETKWPDKIGPVFQAWDTEKGELLRAFGGDDGFWTLALSRDGKLLASGAINKSEVVIWDGETGKEVRRFKHGGTGTLSALAFAPDGKAIAVGTMTGTVELRDVETGKELRTFTEAPNKARINGLAFANDGKLLAVASGANKVAVFDPATGKAVAELKGPEGAVESVTFVAKGYDLLAGGADRAVWLWKANADGPPATEKTNAPRNVVLEGHKGAVGAVAYSSDGHTVATGGADGVVQLWDARTAKTLRTLDKQAKPVAALLFSPDGKRLAVGSERVVRVYEVDSGDKVRDLDVPVFSEAYPLRFTPDGATLFSGPAAKADAPLKDGHVAGWDLRSGKESRGFPLPTDGRAAAFSVDGTLVATVGGSDGRIMVVETRTGTEVAGFHGEFEKTVSALEFLPDGSALAIGGSDGKVRVMSLKGAKGAWTPEAVTVTKAKVLALAFGPGGKRLAVTDADGGVTLLDGETGKVLERFKGHGGAVTSVAFAPDGNRLLTGGTDRTARLWEVKDGAKK